MLNERQLQAVNQKKYMCFGIAKQSRYKSITVLLSIIFYISIIFQLSGITALAYFNPADPAGKSMYPSGVKEIDKFYYEAYPTSKKPVLKLNVPVYGLKHRGIEPGIYEAILTSDKKSILLFQSNKLKAQLPVTKIITLSQKCYIPKIDTQRLSSDQILIVYKIENFEIQSIVTVMK